MKFILVKRGVTIATFEYGNVSLQTHSALTAPQNEFALTTEPPQLRTYHLCLIPNHHTLHKPISPLHSPLQRVQLPKINKHTNGRTFFTDPLNFSEPSSTPEHPT